MQYGGQVPSRRGDPKRRPMMNSLKKIIVYVSALAFLFGSADAFAGHSKGRGQQSVRTTTVRVKVKPGQRCGFTNYGGNCHSEHGFDHLSRQEKTMARRLAKYSGISKYQFMRMRVQGYSWRQIARRLDLHPRVVRAARSAKSWRTFRNNLHWCGNG